MAIMIPSECDLSRRIMSEQVVFDIIRKNLPDEWYVFHSFDFVTRDLNKKRWDGEIDFLERNCNHGSQGRYCFLP